MTTVPSNLIPTRITQLPEYAGSSTAGYLPYVLDGVTYKVQFSNIAAVGAVPSSRAITGGGGLTGGGDLTADRVISIAAGGVGFGQLADSGVAAGTYGDASNIPVLSVDQKGRVTVASTTAINLGGYVPTSRSILAGAGLTGGGTLASDRTISLTLSSATPQSGGVPSAGSGTIAAREDHVHPAVDLSDTTETSGVLPMSRGGTGGSLSPVAGALVYSDGSKFDLTTLGSTGQALFGNGAGAPTWHTISTSLSGLTMGFVGSNYTLSGTLGITSGGTGATTAAAAIASLLPSYAGNAGKLLAVNGTANGVEWAVAGTVTSVDVSGGTTGLTSAGGPVTGAGTITLGGTLNVASGGTGATTAATARVNLLPSYAGNANKVLAVNGSATDAEWTLISGTGTVTSVDVSGGTTGLTASGGPITAAGTITLAGTLNVANGGTGVATAPTNGQLLIGNGTGYSVANLTAGSNVTITNTPGGIEIAATGGGGGASYEIGQVVVATDPPSTGTWLATGNYYSKAAYSSLATVVGDVPDLAGIIDEPQAQIPVAFSTAAAPKARYLVATNGTTAVVGGSQGDLRKSTDGTTWTPIISLAATDINEVRYLNGNYIACQVGSSASGVTLFQSTDGSVFNRIWTGLPASSGNTVSAAYGAGRYVVINGGSSSGVAYSSDLVNWTIGAFPSTANTLRRVIFENSLFVTVGINSCFTSSDGITWTSRTIPAGTYTDVIYANSLYVAYGSSGILSTSSDGITWTSQSAGAQTFNQIIYANSLFVAVGTAGTIYTSSDGITWTSRASGTTLALNGVCWNGSNYIAVGANGRVSTSADGITWTLSVDACLSRFDQVEVIDGKTIAFGSSSVVLAGATRSVPLSFGGWAYNPSQTSAPNPRSVTYNGSDLYVAVGNNGNILTSANGESWTGRNSTINSNITSVFHLNGNYIAVSFGSGTNIITSSDAITWTARTAGTAIMNAAAFGASTYVVVGASGAVFSSSDLATWTSQSAGANTFIDVIFGNSLFVAVGAGGAVYTSSDGATWTSQSAGSTQFNRIIYANSLFVAVGNSGVIYTSADGVTWTAQTSNVAGNLNDVVWSGSIFCAVGASGVITTSSDGTTWTARTPAGTTSDTFFSVAWSGTRFVLVNGSNGLAFTSTDGITWTRTRTTNQTVGSRYVGYFGGRFVNARGGNIQISTDGFTWRAADNRQYVATAINRLLKLNGFYYALTSGAGMFQSSDGISFSPVLEMGDVTVAGVAYNASTWVAVASGSPASVWKSTDGTTWVKSANLFDSTASTGGSITDCAYASGNFVLGLSSVTVDGAIVGIGVMTSPDAVTWTVRALPYNVAPQQTFASDGTTLLALINAPATTTGATIPTIVKSTDGGVTWSILTSVQTSVTPIGYANGVWLLPHTVTKDLGSLVNTSNTSSTSRTASGFYVSNGKFAYTLYDTARRVVSNANSPIDFFYSVPCNRLSPILSTASGKEYPQRGNTLLVALTTSNPTVPYVVGEVPLYTYDTATTFWVPPQGAGGGQQAYIYAGP